MEQLVDWLIQLIEQRRKAEDTSYSIQLFPVASELTKWDLH